MTSSRPLRIAFVRPGLGIGGAERLVVDAALELQGRGHEVTLFVGDRQEAQLDEVKAGRVRVVAVGGRLPAHVAQRLRAPAAILRAAWAARALARARPAPDVVVVDLVPHVIPLLRRLVRAPVAYYCHFPDVLLAPRRRGLYALYRAPLDRLEAAGVAAADRVLVNSRFTGSIVQVTFPDLDADAVEVIPPGVEVDATPPPPPSGEPLVLSVNRFDPGKNLGLAIEALAALRERMPATEFPRVRLVLAGHFDARRGGGRLGAGARNVPPRGLGRPAGGGPAGAGASLAGRPGFAGPPRRPGGLGGLVGAPIWFTRGSRFCGAVPKAGGLGGPF